MQDVDKTKEELATEVTQLRQRVAELEKPEVVVGKEAILNALVEHVIHQDREMKILWANETACDSAGLSREELIGRHCYEIWPKRSDPCPDCPVMKAMKTGQLQEVEKITPDGRSWFIRGYPLRDERDDIVGGIEFTLEITERKQTEKELQESEVRFRALFEGAPDAIFLADPESGEILDANPAASHLLLRPHEEIVGLHQSKIHPLHMEKYARERFTEHLQQIRREKQARPIESAVIRSDGSEVPVEVLAQIVHIYGRSVIQGTFRDITERKQSEEALKQSEEKFRGFIETSNDLVFQLNSAARIDYVSPRVTELYGYEPTELIGKHLRTTTPLKEVSKALEALKMVFAGKTLENFEINQKDKIGRIIPMEINAVPIYKDGKIVGIQGVMRNITARKQSEEKLRESEERFRTIFETAQDFIALKDRDCKFTYVNPAMERVFGISASKLIGKTSVALFGKGKSARIIEEDLRVLSGEIINEEHPSPVKGSSAIHNIIKVPIRNSAGEIIGLCNIGRDITERKQMEEALRESEEKYRSLVESSEDSIYLVDSKCNYIFLNNRHLARLGVQSSEIIGKGYSEFHNPEESKDFAQRIKTVLKTGQSLSYEYRSQRDNRYFIQTLSPVTSPDGGVIKAITVTSKDITERKRAEEMLRESEAKYRNLFEHTKDAVFVADAQTGIIIDANMAACNMLDMPREKIIGMHQSQLHPPAEVERYQQIFRNHVENKVAITEELFVQRPDSKRIPVDISASVMELAGKSIIQGSFRDITERKQAEELLQKERDNFYSILERAPYGVMVLEADGKFSFVNAEFTNISGYTLEDIRPASKWMHRAYPDQHYRNMVKETWKNDYTQSKDEETFRKRFGRTFSRAFTVICKDGAAKDIEFRTAFIGDEGTMFMLSDITERQRMLALLETAAAEWRTTFDAINDAVCLLDPYGKIIRCNNAMLRLLGKSFSQIMNHHCWEVIHGVSEAPQSCPIARVGKTHQRESEVMFKDARWINISVDPLLDEDGDLIGSVHIMSDITDRMRIQNELQDSREQLRNLTVHLESVREQERTNIAREIHDELAQTLTALKMDLSWLDHRLPRDPQSLSEKTKSMNNLIDSTLQTVKRISAELRPGILDDLGLVAAIEWQAEEFQNRTGISCNVTVDPQDLTVDQDLSTAIFRIFQETLTNVARHAHATNVAVGLKERAERLTLRVRDNGTGIKEEQIFDPKSFGLIGIRERVYPWGGKFSIKGIPGKGTTVVVNVRLGQSKKDIEKN
jgi:PAS domain S-box-containing protein